MFQYSHFSGVAFNKIVGESGDVYSANKFETEDSSSVEEQREIVHSSGYAGSSSTVSLPNRSIQRMLAKWNIDQNINIDNSSDREMTIDDLDNF